MQPVYSVAGKVSRFGHGLVIFFSYFFLTELHCHSV
uniref:Uncharacterized protein n=1 Tax=Anguilla anguilla TaxID=7936 RepID=A0A0E9QU87_ANGAN